MRCRRFVEAPATPRARRRAWRSDTPKDLVLDPRTGRVAYAVLDFGGFLGIGNKLFAVPLESMTLDTKAHRFVLDVDKERLENAPGFDKSDWP